MWVAETRLKTLVAIYRSSIISVLHSGPGTGIIDRKLLPFDDERDIIDLINQRGWSRLDQTILSRYPKSWTMPQQPNIPLALCSSGDEHKLQSYQIEAFKAVRQSCMSMNQYESIVVDMQKGTGKTGIMSCTLAMFVRQGILCKKMTAPQAKVVTICKPNAKTKMITGMSKFREMQIQSNVSKFRSANSNQARTYLYAATLDSTLSSRPDFVFLLDRITQYAQSQEASKLVIIIVDEPQDISEDLNHFVDLVNGIGVQNGMKVRLMLLSADMNTNNYERYPQMQIIQQNIRANPYTLIRMTKLPLQVKPPVFSRILDIHADYMGIDGRVLEHDKVQTVLRYINFKPDVQKALLAYQKDSEIARILKENQGNFCNVNALIESCRTYTELIANLRLNRDKIFVGFYDTTNSTTETTSAMVADLFGTHDSMKDPFEIFGEATTYLNIIEELYQVRDYRRCLIPLLVVDASVTGVDFYNTSKVVFMDNTWTDVASKEHCSQIAARAIRFCSCFLREPYNPVELVYVRQSTLFTEAESNINVDLVPSYVLEPTTTQQLPLPPRGNNAINFVDLDELVSSGPEDREIVTPSGVLESLIKDPFLYTNNSRITMHDDSIIFKQNRTETKIKLSSIAPIGSALYSSLKFALKDGITAPNAPKVDLHSAICLSDGGSRIHVPNIKTSFYEDLGHAFTNKKIVFDKIREAMRTDKVVTYIKPQECTPSLVKTIVGLAPLGTTEAFDWICSAAKTIRDRQPVTTDLYLKFVKYLLGNSVKNAAVLMTPDMLVGVVHFLVKWGLVSYPFDNAYIDFRLKVVQEDNRDAKRAKFSHFFSGSNNYHKVRDLPSLMSSSPGFMITNGQNSFIALDPLSRMLHVTSDEDKAYVFHYSITRRLDCDNLLRRVSEEIDAVVQELLKDICYTLESPNADFLQKLLLYDIDYIRCVLMICNQLCRKHTYVREHHTKLLTLFVEQIRPNTNILKRTEDTLPHLIDCELEDTLEHILLSSSFVEYLGDIWKYHKDTSLFRSACEYVRMHLLALMDIRRSDKISRLTEIITGITRDPWRLLRRDNEDQGDQGISRNYRHDQCLNFHDAFNKLCLAWHKKYIVGESYAFKYKLNQCLSDIINGGEAEFINNPNLKRFIRETQTWRI